MMIINELHRLMIDDPRSFEQIGTDSGVDAPLIWRWRKSRNLPRLGNFEAVLNTLGYRLEIEQHGTAMPVNPRPKPINAKSRNSYITQVVFDLIFYHGLTMDKIASFTNLSRHSFVSWGVRTDPLMENLERALNGLGYRLVIVRKEHDQST